MSPEADVMEMQSICGELADKLASARGLKARTEAIYGVFHDEARKPLISWNRAFDFLCGRARRVDSWEKDHAKRRRDELRRQEAVEHVNNLNRTLAYLRTADPDGYGAHIDAVERSLSMAGVLDRSMAPASSPAQPTKGDE